MEGNHFRSFKLDKLHSQTVDLMNKSNSIDNFENMFIDKVKPIIIQSNGVFNINFNIDDEKETKEEDDFNDSTSSDYSCDDFEEDKKIIRDKEDEIKFDFTKKKRKRIHKTCK